MSLYDKASLIFSGAAGAGNKDVAYNIKPVEKLKVDEHVTNGGFDDDSSWAKVNSPTFSNGQVRFQASDGTNRKIYQTGVFEGGKTYKVSFDVVEIKEGEIRIGTGFNSVEITSVVNGGPISTPGSHSLIFKNQGRTNDDWIFFQPHTPSDPYDFTIDNVSVREVEQKAVDFTMVRGSNLTATREAPSGLIEKGRENLLKYSNGFDNALWEGYASGNTLISTVTSGQSGYDGSSNAFLLNKDSSDLFKRREQIITETTGVATFSVYAKAGTASSISLRGGSDDAANVQNGNDDRADFNLANGTSTIFDNAVTSSMEAITGSPGDTDRWYRCSVVFKDPTQLVQIYLNFNSASTGTVFIQNAQLEQGFVATEYIHTTDSYSKKTAGVLENEPRYDYSGGDAALLLEPERTNLVTSSEGNISQMGGAATRTYKPDEVSPTGYKEGVVELSNLLGATGDRWQVVVDISDSLPSTAKTWTGSLYIKGTSGEKMDYQIKRVNAGDFIGSDIETVTFDGTWQRITATFTNRTDNDEAGFFLVKRDSSTADKVLIWGRQIEEGSYATSYIPTYGSAATRDDDVFVNLQDIPKVNLDKYTFFAYNESERKTSHNRGPRMSGNGNSSLMGYFGNGDLKKQFFLYDNDGSTVFSEHTFDSFTAGDDVKYAFVIDNISMTAELFINGVSRKTASLTARVDASKISSSNSEGDADNIKSIMYFPEALSDADAVSLTTI